MRFAAVLLLHLLAVPVLAAPPAPADAGPADFRPPGSAEVSRTASAADRRAWLQARLSAGLQGDPARLRLLEQNLAVMSDEQLTALIQVYEQTRQRRAVDDPQQLAGAQQELEQLKAYRDMLLSQLIQRRAWQQLQYDTFVGPPGGFSYGMNVGPFGYSAAYGGPYSPSPGFYGAGFGAPGPFGPAVGTPMPFYGGYFPGMGAAY